MITKLAEKFVQENLKKINKKPVDLEKILFLNNIEIKLSDIAKKETKQISGFSYKTNKKKYIVVNINLNLKKRREVIANELFFSCILNEKHVTYDCKYESYSRFFCSKILIPDKKFYEEYQKINNARNLIDNLSNKFLVTNDLILKKIKESAL